MLLLFVIDITYYREYLPFYAYPTQKHPAISWQGVNHHTYWLAGNSNNLRPSKTLRSLKNGLQTTFIILLQHFILQYNSNPRFDLPSFSGVFQTSQNTNWGQIGVKNYRTKAALSTRHRKTA